MSAVDMDILRTFCAAAWQAGFNASARSEARGLPAPVNPFRWSSSEKAIQSQPKPSVASFLRRLEDMAPDSTLVDRINAERKRLGICACGADVDEVHSPDCESFA